LIAKEETGNFLLKRNETFHGDRVNLPSSVSEPPSNLRR